MADPPDWAVGEPEDDLRAERDQLMSENTPRIAVKLRARIQELEAALAKHHDRQKYVTRCFVCDAALDRTEAPEGV